MGKLFKAIAFADPKLGEPPGFESWQRSADALAPSASMRGS
jgi:hypothetical protein